MTHKLLDTSWPPADLIEAAYLIAHSHVYAVEIPPGETYRLRIEFELEDGRRFRLSPAEVEVSYEGEPNAGAIICQPYSGEKEVSYEG